MNQEIIVFILFAGALVYLFVKLGPKKKKKKALVDMENYNKKTGCGCGTECPVGRK